MTGQPEKSNPEPNGFVRRGTGFMISGTLAFLTDAVLLMLLNRGLGIDPYLARAAAIATAMAVGFFAHRRLTFGIRGRPSVSQFTGYAALAWSTAALNYAVYALILLGRPGTDPLLAMIAASIVAMGVSYAGMHFSVFRRHDPRGDAKP